MGTRDNRSRFYYPPIPTMCSQRVTTVSPSVTTQSRAKWTGSCGRRVPVRLGVLVPMLGRDGLVAKSMFMGSEETRKEDEVLWRWSRSIMIYNGIFVILWSYTTKYGVIFLQGNLVILCLKRRAFSIFWSFKVMCTAHVVFSIHIDGKNWRSGPFSKKLAVWGTRMQALVVRGAIWKTSGSLGG
jgi:hypothetical protein